MSKILFSFIFVFGGLSSLAARDDEAEFYKLNMSPHAVAMRKHAREAMEKARRDHARQQQQEQLAKQKPEKKKPITRVDSSPGATPEPVPRSNTDQVAGNPPKKPTTRVNSSPGATPRNQVPRSNANREASNPPSATEQLSDLMPKPLPARLCREIPKQFPGGGWPIPPTHSETDRKTLIERIKVLRRIRNAVNYRAAVGIDLHFRAKHFRGNTKAAKRIAEKFQRPRWGFWIGWEYDNAVKAENRQAKRLGVEPYIPENKAYHSEFQTEDEKARGPSRVSKQIAFREAVKKAEKENNKWVEAVQERTKNQTKDGFGCEEGEGSDRQVAAAEPLPAPTIQRASPGSR